MRTEEALESKKQSSFKVILKHVGGSVRLRTSAGLIKLMSFNFCHGYAAFSIDRRVQLSLAGIYKKQLQSRN